MSDFCKKQPCNNCPYRKDAPLRLWAVEEFEDLLESEKDMIGKVYMCHKKDGKACTGFVMMQDENNIPSIALRISLSRNEVTRAFLDMLNSPSKMFKSIIQMSRANYPEKFKNHVKKTT